MTAAILFAIAIDADSMAGRSRRMGCSFDLLQIIRRSQLLAGLSISTSVPVRRLLLVTSPELTVRKTAAPEGAMLPAKVLPDMSPCANQRVSVMFSAVSEHKPQVLTSVGGPDPFVCGWKQSASSKAQATLQMTFTYAHNKPCKKRAVAHCKAGIKCHCP